MKTTLLTKYILLATYLVCEFIVSTRAVFFPSIQWTPDNPVIQNLNGKVRKVRNEDGLNIWCPKEYTQLEKTQEQVHPSSLYFMLYKVETKAEYDDCDATNGKTLLVCNDPEGKDVEDQEYYFLYFKKIALYPNMDPYPPGKTYYYIGTSGGKDKTLKNKIGGKCASHNLKFAIYICRDDEKDCNVDVLNGGWTMWHKNEKTGWCERNCTNPEPRNGGKPCSGPSNTNCSKVITNQIKTETKAKITTEQPKLATTEPTTHGKTTKKPSTLIVPTTKVTTEEFTTKKDMETNKEPIDDKRKNDDTDDVTLSMKGAVLTFMGLFILGCIVGIVQVILIIHIRSKRSGKQPEPPVIPV